MIFIERVQVGVLFVGLYPQSQGNSHNKAGKENIPSCSISTQCEQYTRLTINYSMFRTDNSLHRSTTALYEKLGNKMNGIKIECGSLQKE